MGNKMNRRIYPVALMAITAVTYVFTSCGAPTSTTTTGGSTSDSLSEFAESLAEDMLVASPTASRSATGFSVNDIHRLDTSNPSDGLSKKKDALEALLSSTAPASCAISLTIQNSTNANCYGPSVSYSNHSFDASSGSWPGGDLGIWEASAASGEACASDQLNSRLKGVASYADLAVFMMSGMACVANKAGSELPAASANLDITTNMTGNLTINGSSATVSSAVIYRDADVSGAPVYRYVLTATQGTKTYTLRTKHMSLDATDATYRGKISVKVGDSDPASKTGNCGPSTATGSQQALSMSYEKTSASAAKYLVKSAEFCGHDADPFVSGSDFSVDLTKVYTTTTVEKGWGNNANYFLAEFDPSTYTGKFYYAWQAGKGDSHTRTFNLVLAGSSTAVTGSAFFGFGPTMQVGPGGITGMICAWTGPDQSHTPIAFVQRQDVAVTAPATMFTASSSNVTYDPVNTSCETSAAMIMTWAGGASTRDASTTTNNLVAVSQVSTAMGTTPTNPTEVD